MPPAFFFDGCLPGRIFAYDELLPAGVEAGSEDYKCVVVEPAG